MTNKEKKKTKQTKKQAQTSEIVFLFGIVIQCNNLACVIYYFIDCLWWFSIANARGISMGNGLF